MKEGETKGRKKGRKGWRKGNKLHFYTQFLNSKNSYEI